MAGSRAYSRRSQRVAVALGLSLVAVAGVAIADEDSDGSKPRSQSDTVRAVTLQRSTVFESPRSTAAAAGIDLGDELRVAPARSVGDMLRDKETVFVQQPSYGFANPNLRGLGEGRVALYVDDVRLTNTITSTLPGGLSNLNLVDPYTVRGVEVVHGSGLGPYGEGGLGGTVLLRTLRPSPIAGSQIELSAGARGIYASPDQGAQGSVTGAGRWNRFALESAFSVRRFRDVMGGSQGGTSPQPNTAYNEGGLYLGLGVDTGHGTLSAVYQGLRQYDGIRSERSRTGDVYALPELARDLGYLRYDGEFEVSGRAIETHAVVSYQRQSELSARQIVAVNQLARENNRVDVLGASVRLRSDLGRGGNLAAGLESSFEWVGSSAERARLSEGAGGFAEPAPSSSRYPSGSRAQTFALFLQDELDLLRLATGQEADSGSRLHALIAARAGGSFLYMPENARVGLFNAVGVAVPESQLSRAVYGGSLHLRYEPVLGFALFAGGMLGVRPATLDDQARLDDGRPGILLPAAAPLGSESSYSAEAGLRAAYRRLDGGLTYAFTYLADPILVVPTVVGGRSCAQATLSDPCIPLYTRQNGAAASLHSIEATARVYLFWGLTAFATVAYTHAPATPDGAAPLPRIPPVHGVAALEFRRPRTVFTFVQLLFRWAGPQRLLAVEDAWDPTICPLGGPCSGTPGFYVLSLRSALRLSRQIQLSAAIDNISNESYRFHGSGVDGPGIGARLGLDANY